MRKYKKGDVIKCAVTTPFELTIERVRAHDYLVEYNNTGVEIGLSEESIDEYAENYELMNTPLFKALE